MFNRIGIPELILILVIALIIFGPRKLPEIARSIGKSIKEFRRVSSEVQKPVDNEDDIDESEAKKSEKE